MTRRIALIIAVAIIWIPAVFPSHASEDGDGLDLMDNPLSAQSLIYHEVGELSDLSGSRAWFNGAGLLADTGWLRYGMVLEPPSLTMIK